MLVLSLSILIAVAAAYLLFRADQKRAVPYPALTSSLRGLLVFLCMVLLLAPKINKRTSETLKPLVLLVQDNSQSVPAALGNQQAAYNKQLQELVEKLSSKYRLVSWNLQGPASKDSLDRYTAGTTNLTYALDQAGELYSQQNLSAVILASDGWYNEGVNPLYSEIPLSGSLYTIAIGDTALSKDLRIAKVYANKTTSLNSQWEVRADILARKCAGMQQNVSLTDAAGNIVATAPVSITGDRFDASVSFSVKADKAGLHQYRIIVPEQAGEANTANNKASVFVDVLQEKKKILLLAAAPHPDVKAITEAMKSLEQYELTVKTASELSGSFAEYSAVILHGLPSNTHNVSPASLQGKSVWYIAGLQNNYFQLNALQKVSRFGMGMSPRSVEAQYNKSFTVFTLPANIASVTDILPPLTVVSPEISNQMPGQAIFTGVNDMPLWSVFPGAVPVAVTTGEGIWRWRLYEFKNFGTQNTIDECIRQTLNFLTANNRVKPFRTELPKYIWNNTEHITINAYLYNANNETVNQPEAQLSIKDSAGYTRNFSLERNGTSYRIDIGALPAGNYSYVAQTTFNGSPLKDAGSFAVEATSIESLETGCNYPLLYELARKHKGAAFNTANLLSVYDSINRNNTIRPLISEHIESTDLINLKWIFALILLVATTEWLLRKYWMAM
jgi:hypothetical protein